MMRFDDYITYIDFVPDADGNVVERRCTYDPATRGADSPDGGNLKGTIHSVAAAHAVAAEVRLYDHLFTTPYPAAERAPLAELLDTTSLEVLTDCGRWCVE